MFEDNDNVYLIKQQPNESNKYYYTKCKFISNVLKKKSLDYYLKMANIYTNNKLYNCVYSDSIMKELKSLIS